MWPQLNAHEMPCKGEIHVGTYPPWLTNDFLLSLGLALSEEYGLLS